ncbi:hypothetical protein [uncultured Novosphingobium sp.]|uniref:terminase small subunit-like protein n=1 Tax=uncultured Novosphingobium sp. TaxID=292277 RepID=UPI00258755DA|nr:hypothetical protein [uncultured Novosphingobium sp.]
MAQKKLPNLDEPSKRAVQCAAKTQAGAKALAELADRNLAESETEAWRNVSAVHKEIILYRIRGGELLTTICRSIGIDPGNIRNLAAMDDEFDKRLAAACEQGQHAWVEKLYQIPYDESLSDARVKLLSDNIKWIAGRSNRKAYGEHFKVDQTITVQPVAMPDWSFGQVIEGTITKSDPDEAE